MNLIPLKPASAKDILEKALALLCFLILPLLFYILTAYLTAAVFLALLSSMEKTSGAARFLEANLPIIYSGTAALFTGSVLGLLYRRPAVPGFRLSLCGRFRRLRGSLLQPSYGAFQAAGAVFFPRRH